MSLSRERDIGSYITARFADQIDAVAAGTGDATESSGPYTQRPDGAQSCKLVIAWEAVLTEAKTLSLAVNIQDASASDGTGVGDFGTALAATVVATGGSGGSTVQGVTELDFNLAGAKEYLRSQITPDLNHSGTDTLRLSAVWIFGGTASLPAA